MQEKPSHPKLADSGETTMQETEFIKQNKDKWAEFESVLGNPNKDPDRLTNLFIETTDDLSYSRTYYPNRSVRVYLNGIAQQIYQAIYKNKKGERNAFLKFWTVDLPNDMYYHRMGLTLAFWLLAMGVTIGIVSSIFYPDFARIMLGSSYVEMTQQNINNGNPMAVYQDENAFEMFFRIAWNNIRVSFLCFLTGIFFAAGTTYVIFINSISVGAFVYFFIERNLFKEMFLALMLHGTLELSMILLSGCAGYALARGMLFPGTYTRIQALTHSARSGIRIMLAVSAFLVLAAIIESFATRYSQVNNSPAGQHALDIIRAIIIIASLGIVVGYFVIYPRYRHKKGLVPPEKIEDMAPTNNEPLVKDAISTLGKMFTTAFRMLNLASRKISYLAMACSALIVIGYAALNEGNMSRYFEAVPYYVDAEWLWVWSEFDLYLNIYRHPEYILVLLPVLTLWINTISRMGIQLIGRSLPSKFNSWFASFCLALYFILLILLPTGWTVFLMFTTFPILLLWFTVSQTENRFHLGALGRTFHLMKSNYFNLIGIVLFVLLIQWITFFILNSQIMSLLIEFIQLNLSRSFTQADQVPYYFYGFILFFIPAFMFALTFFGVQLLYFSAKEMNDAENLSQRISNIGFRKRAYGLEKEI